MNTYCFIRRNLYKTLLLCCFLAFTGSMQAQEFLTGLGKNTQIIKEAQQHKERLFKSKAENESLLLPFFEDFSNYTGYPNEKLFIDKQAFVNNTFPIFPPSIGVVTLDALNERGELYSHLTAVSKGADTLTSRYIRLDLLFLADTIREITLADSLYFSFYFQPGGAGIIGTGLNERIGNQPNTNDSLVLEFGYTVLEDTVYTVYWDHIWSTPGFNVDKWTSENPLEYFKQVLIPIVDEKYLCDNFQFRFRNYASLEPQQGITGWEGNVDQWHIDYIRLDVGRNHEDKFTNDLAFVSPTTSFLKNYQAMPWNQFQSSDMKSNFTNQLTNLNERGGVRTSRYEYTIAQNENVVDRYETGAIDIFPYVTDGIQTDSYQVSPVIKFNPTLTDTTTFKITHVFRNAAGIDFSTANDTCVFEQKFLNYYAYDDGTAEYGYCLNNQYGIAYFAMKFSLRVPDSLSAVRMWFNHTKNSENKEAMFSIVVWKDDHGQPGMELYTLEGKQPDFEKQFLDFVEYKFDKKVPVSGTVWVGFKQQGNVQLNIGFDQNTDSREFVRLNTRGYWETSVLKGTPMLRPVFGEAKKTNPGNIPKFTTKVEPNPASDKILVTSYELQVTNVEIYDVMGRKQRTEGEKQKAENKWEVNVSHLPAGIYFVRIYKKNNSFETLKLIKN